MYWRWRDAFRTFDWAQIAKKSSFFDKSVKIAGIEQGLEAKI